MANKIRSNPYLDASIFMTANDHQNYSQKHSKSTYVVGDKVLIKPSRKGQILVSIDGGSGRNKHFAVGKWYGIRLTEKRGTSDGRYKKQSPYYFKCAPNFGVFVQAKLIIKKINDQTFDFMNETQALQLTQEEKPQNNKMHSKMKQNNSRNGHKPIKTQSHETDKKLKESKVGTQSEIEKYKLSNKRLQKQVSEYKSNNKKLRKENKSLQNKIALFGKHKNHKTAAVKLEIESTVIESLTSNIQALNDKLNELTEQIQSQHRSNEVIHQLKEEIKFLKTQNQIPVPINEKMIISKLKLEVATLKKKLTKSDTHKTDRFKIQLNVSENKNERALVTPGTEFREAVLAKYQTSIEEEDSYSASSQSSEDDLGEDEKIEIAKRQSTRKKDSRIMSDFAEMKKEMTILQATIGNDVNDTLTLPNQTTNNNLFRGSTVWEHSELQGLKDEMEQQMVHLMKGAINSVDIT